LIEVNLLPGGKKRPSRGPRLGLKLPSAEALPTDPWVLGSAALVLILLALAGYLYFSTSSRKAELEVAIEEAVADSARYADLIEQNSALMARRDSIAQRVNIIQEIDSDRYVWPHIMDEVARALPDYTWLNSLMQISLGEDLQFRIEGRAGNNFALTQFMENLEASLFIRNVDLISTEQVVETAGGGSRLVNHFVLDAYYEQPPPELLETVPLFETEPEEPATETASETDTPSD
jgi:Tfp pilus assembly protein PilN